MRESRVSWLKALSMVIDGLLALLLLTGCQIPVQTGVVHGTLEIEGGPPPGEHPEPGKVVLLNKSYRTVDISVPANGKFSATVPVGTYEVYGGIPKYDYTENACFGTPATITIAAGSIREIVVNCNE